MKFTRTTAFAALTVAALAFAPAANAANAKLADCIQMGKQVSAALVKAQPGTATDMARNQAQAGQNACMASAYAKGVAYYSKALQLLGKS
jgi:hypothetical protein